MPKHCSSENVKLQILLKPVKKWNTRHKIMRNTVIWELKFTIGYFYVKIVCMKINAVYVGTV